MQIKELLPLFELNYDLVFLLVIFHHFEFDIVQNHLSNRIEHYRKDISKSFPINIKY